MTDPKKPERRCRLEFQEDYHNLNAVTTEISSALIVGDTLFVSYDEDAGIEKLTPKDDGYGNHEHYEMADFFDLPSDDDEMDIESLAYCEPYLWFCGSMSLKRNTPDEDDDIEEGVAKLAEVKQDKNRFSLGCIPCIKKDGHYHLVKEGEYNGKTIKPLMLKGGTYGNEIHNMLLNDQHLKRYMDIPCKDNGFDIEGLAVEDDRIFLGLRGPVLGGFAVIIEISYISHDNMLTILPQDGEDHIYRKHFIDLQGMGIRELNIDKKGDMYILAGPTMDLDGTISIYKIPDALDDVHATIIHDPVHLFDTVRTHAQHGYEKAEGLAFIDEKTILITYDSPIEDRLINDYTVEMDVFKLD
jgi:hypothetical protein